jgi:hypothetical protein
VTPAGGFRDTNGSVEVLLGNLARASDASGTDKWARGQWTVVVHLPAPGGATELNVGSLTVTDYCVGHRITANEAVAVVC